MSQNKRSYENGSIFCVPLRNDGYAIGLVARNDQRGLVFGYFFGPRLQSVPDAVDTSILMPQNAILVGQFGDNGLRKRKWKRIGAITPWCPEDWPMPLFTCAGKDDHHVTVTEYDENTLNTKSVSSVPRTAETENLLPDRVMGHGFVEIKLTDFL